VNVVNSIMGYECLFLVECAEEAEVLIISSDDFKRVKGVHLPLIDLHEEIIRIENKYAFIG